MRHLIDHIVVGRGSPLIISIEDEPGQGGANHLYTIEGFNTSTNSSDPFVSRHGQPAKYSTIIFQNGPIQEYGVNGVTHEALLAILIDRLRGFQNGPFKCRENAIALTELESALMWLQKRTRDRIARGVEGTNQL